MPATNRVLHDRLYYMDGIICEPPKKIEGGEAAASDQTAGKLSQSRWNDRDYHWEERDLLAAAKGFVQAELEGMTLWVKGDDKLVFVDVKLEGNCVSNVRKGRRILTYDLVLKVKCEGRRGGAGIDALLTSREICHDDDSPLVEDDIHVHVSPRPLPQGFDTQRAVRTHELFNSLLRKRGRAALVGAVASMCKQVRAKGGDTPSFVE